MAAVGDEEGDPCHLLALPAELRNYIWELVFTSPASVDFLDTSPPPKSLLLTCRHIHSKTKHLYKIQFQLYWSTTVFTIDPFHDLPCTASSTSIMHRRKALNRERQTQVYAKIETLRDDDVAHIKQVLIPRDYECKYWRLGDPSSDIWFVHGQIPPNQSLGRSWISVTSLHLFCPIEKAAVLEAEGVHVGTLWTSRTQCAVAVDGWRQKRIARVIEITGKAGLSKEELMCPIREACADHTMSRQHRAGVGGN